MGFPSPAQDYIEHRLNLNDILMPHPANMMCIETPEGFVLVDRSLKPVPGNTVAFQLDDSTQLGKLSRSGIITQDGEPIDGDRLEGVIVLGKVTAIILVAYEAYRPII
ncbi:LexA family protein [Pantoea agglomerans]|uniref:LexA family protein n=1 Tax=Enterobacter agglomerans TaxID=549 RepID=UPI00241308C6|nr:phage repressor protein [Pantoea agglomerans]